MNHSNVKNNWDDENITPSDAHIISQIPMISSSPIRPLKTALTSNRLNYLCQLRFG